MYIPPFNITNEILSLVAEISEAVGQLNVIMSDNLPHPMLRKQNRIKTIQSSLAIENNSLTLDQVTDIVEGKRVLGAPNEIQEVKSAIKAYDILLEINPFKEKDLLRVHKLLMQDLMTENGRYRSTNGGVFGKNKFLHLAPQPSRVPKLMNNLFHWIKNTKTHPLISSCVFHYEFEFIHPFVDGNGRMGRLWQTALLAKWKPVFAWMPVETIVKEHQKEYYNSIKQSATEENCTHFILFMLKCIKKTINEIETPKETPIKTSKETPKEVIISLIQQNPKTTVQQMADAIGINKRNTQKHVNALSEEGLIRHVGSARGGHWETR